MNFLTDIGIDFHYEAELHDWGSAPENGKLLCNGWYHCVGQIMSGPTNSPKPASVDKWPWHILESNLKLIISAEKDCAFEEFKRLPLVQIQFNAELPWVLDE